MKGQLSDRRQNLSAYTKSWLILHALFFILGIVIIISVKGVHFGAYVQNLFSFLHFLTDVAIGTATALLSVIVFQWIITLAGETSPREIKQWMREIGPRQGYLIMASTSLGEEWIFRGVIQGLLTAWLGVAPAILITTIIFTLLHIQVMRDTPVQLAIAGADSVILGILYYGTGALYAPIAFHAVYNVLEVWHHRDECFHEETELEIIH
jgi:membrane protease YdiL (CAAX protease family)